MNEQKIVCEADSFRERWNWNRNELAKLNSIVCTCFTSKPPFRRLSDFKPSFRPIQAENLSPIEFQFVRINFIFMRIESDDLNRGTRSETLKKHFRKALQLVEEWPTSLHFFFVSCHISKFQFLSKLVADVRLRDIGQWSNEQIRFLSRGMRKAFTPTA